MTRMAMISRDPAVLHAALEGFELQRKRIDEQIIQVRALLGKRQNGVEGGAETQSTGRKQLSSAARKRIAAAQTKRWAEFRKTHSQTKEKK